MGVVALVRAHLDATVAVVLAAIYVAEAVATERVLLGAPLLDGLATDADGVLIIGAAFLLSLAVRSRWPLVPLVFASVAWAAAGSGSIEASPVLLVGVVLTTYSVGAWAGGTTAAVGGVGLGGLIGLAVLRGTTTPLDPSIMAVAALVLVGPWVLGLAVRRVRLERGHPRLVADAADRAAMVPPDQLGRDELVRDLRDGVERSMSLVVMQARTARAVLPADPRTASASLDVVESTGREILTETQRITGLLLAPDGVPLPEGRLGLADLDALAEQISDAGLPVAMRVEGTPLALTADLDGVAYDVIHAALVSTLEHATASVARVVVRYLRDALEVEVSDDGAPIDEDDVSESTADLVAAREEVITLGGSLDAGPHPDGGYWVLARIPVEPDWA